MQADILIFLGEHEGKWFSARQISKKIKISRYSINMNLRRLRKHKLIEFKIEDNQFVYKAKERVATDNRG